MNHIRPIRQYRHLSVGNRCTAAPQIAPTDLRQLRAHGTTTVAAQAFQFASTGSAGSDQITLQTQTNTRAHTRTHARTHINLPLFAHVYHSIVPCLTPT